MGRVPGRVGHLGHVGHRRAHAHHLRVGEEHVAGVGAPGVHLHTVRLPNLLERFFQLNRINKRYYLLN